MATLRIEGSIGSEVVSAKAFEYQKQKEEHKSNHNQDLLE
jgi:hypothetical protein